jgi:hypothetical protein
LSLGAWLIPAWGLIANPPCQHSLWEESGVPGENLRLSAECWLTLSHGYHKVHNGNRTHDIRGERRVLWATEASGVTEGCFGAQWWGEAWGGGDKNDHKSFASTLGKLVRASVIEGQKICNGPPPKAGIGKIVKFGPYF